MAQNNKKKPNGKNPANSDSDLFKALTKIFSGPLIDFRTQSGKRIRRQHMDKFSSRFKSASGQQFKKTTYNPLDTIATNSINNVRRGERYIDFDQMEFTPEIASALDIYADEMTTYSELRPMLNIKCPNEEIKAMLKILYFNVMNIEHNLFGWCRTLAKYGDFMLYLDIDENTGIQSTIALPLQEIERLEGLDSTNPNYIQFQWNSGGMTFENWQVAHFRILGNDKYAPYGTSILEPARRIWRQLTLMEDAMMAYRIIRSSERKLFKIDVGGIAPQDVEQFMEKTVSSLKRHSIVNPTTGQIDLRYNPMSIEEDYFIPVRQGSATDISTIAGGANTTAIDDIKYLRDKLFSALKVPQSYLTMGEGATEDKTTLAQKDIRFARTIQRLQRVVISELEKIGIIHLYTLGFRGDELLSFSLSLNNPSKIAEIQELEHWKAKFEIAGAATEGFFSRRWISENLLGMSHEEFIRCQREMYYDRKHDADLQNIVEESNDVGTGNFDGIDLGPSSDIGGIDTQNEPTAETPEAQAPEEEPGALLAAPPGSRPSKRLVPSAKIRKVKQKLSSKKRNDYKYHDKNDHRGSGARTRNYRSLGGLEISNRTLIPGMQDMNSLGNGIMEEGYFDEKDSIYNLNEHIEEQNIFNINEDVKILIENLETKKNKKVLVEHKNEA